MAKPAWLAALQPASFRGVPFKWLDVHDEGGRRQARFSYPKRDLPYAEDMGRRAGEWPTVGYLIGPDYLTQWIALKAAFESDAGAGTYVHPYEGALTVVVGKFRKTETQKEGGICRFEVEFFEPGSLPAPSSVTDTATGVGTTAQAAATANIANFTLSIST